MMVAVIDARDPHKVPVRLLMEEDAVKHKEEWKSGDWMLFCVEMDGKYVACAQKKGEPILMCAEYKTMRGFDSWRKRQ